MESSNGNQEQLYKLPNSLIDACVVYGLNEQPSESLQSRFSKSKVRNLEIMPNTYHPL